MLHERFRPACGVTSKARGNTFGNELWLQWLICSCRYTEGRIRPVNNPPSLLSHSCADTHMLHIFLGLYEFVAESPLAGGHGRVAFCSGTTHTLKQLSAAT